jgi:uncharacterized protein
MDINFVMLAVVTAVSYLTLAFSGFGTVVIALTLGAHFFPIKTLLPILVPLTPLANLYILARYYKNIDTAVLFKKILPMMGAGFVAGIVIFNYFHGDILKKILGVLVIVLALHELAKFLKTDAGTVPLSRSKSAIALVSSGIVQGIYASGGPLLVYVINRLNLPKAVFRSTLSATWLILNPFLTVSYIVSGELTLTSAKLSVMLLPSLVIGLAAGELLHRRIDETAFKFCVSVLLLVAGAAVFIR